MKTESSASAIEAAVRQVGRDLFARMARAETRSAFSRHGAFARIMERAMRDPMFKAQLFRFIDVLPALTSNEEIVRHLQEYLGDRAVDLHPALRAGLGAASLAPALVARTVKAQVKAVARQFIAGENADQLVRRLLANARAGIATTIDLLGETVVSAAEADAFLQRNLDVLDIVSRALARERRPCFSDIAPSGPLPRVNLSLKISALTPELHPAAPERSLAALAQRLRPILRRAAELGAFINFDMESYALKDLTLALFRMIAEEPEFAAAPMLGIAQQAYLRDCEQDLRELVAWARTRQRRITIRLVKGAYWDYETVLAAQRGWPSPVWPTKAATDAAFERCTTFLLGHADIITTAIATHNVRSCAHAIARAEDLGIPPTELEFQALFGMADDLKRALIERGHRVREYCPVGELLPGMAYLVRRLLENTSNEGFLRQRAGGEAGIDELLAPPQEAAPAPEPGERLEVKATSRDGTHPPFRNAPNTDFTRRSARDKFAAAIARENTAAPRHAPLIIGGEPVSPPDFLEARNPARPAQVLGHWAKARVADADAAIAAARAAFPSWRGTPVDRRCAFLERVAERLEARRASLSALMILEAGKPWTEADADVSEAVDFCRFYAAEMRRLGVPAVTQVVAGEDVVQTWTPRGVGAVIAPWNFPLAILCGMTVAPVVAGNTVVMKPAEQTTLIGAAFMNVLIEAGLPPGVVNFLPGLGEEVGAHLVAHPEIDFVAFTGSRAVGCAIWETAGRTPPGQRNLKKVVCEMGGKNALIIDQDADLDEAIPAALASAFAYAGQKCSALSRLIVHDGVYSRFIDRFVAAAASVPVGDPCDPATVVGPLIDREAHARVRQYLEQGRREAQLAWQASLPPDLQDGGGYYVPPAIFTDVRPEHTIAREEIFGPVVAVLRARDLDDALAIANGSDYALTGGMFSRSPSALARARRRFLVGNLYLNRGITGAIVERHPFGGFRMSGAGTKAGGRGYLENFMFPRVIAENTLRRGFTPPERDAR